MAELAPGVLILGGLVLIVLGWFRRTTGLGWLVFPSWIACLCAFAAALLGWRQPSLTTGASGDGFAARLGGALAADPLGFASQALVSAVVFFVLATSVGYVGWRRWYAGEFGALILFAGAAMMLTAVAADLVVVFLALETFALALYVLTAYRRGDPLGEEAAFKFFVLGSFAAVFLLAGIAVLYVVTGATGVSEVADELSGPVARSPMVILALALVLTGLAFKLAVAPFHQWAPDVYQGAPTPVTALMAVATKIAVFALAVRLLWITFAAQAELWLPVLGALAVVTMIVGNLGALTQRDVKRMLAYSTIAHTGYLLVALMAVPHGGLAALFGYLVAYAIMNLGAFAVLGIVERSSGNAIATELDSLRGLAARHGGLAAALGVFLISLAGVPPTAGFVAKWFLLRSAVAAGWPWLALIVILNSVLGAYYYVRPVAFMYIGQPPGEPAVPVRALRSDAWTVGALAVATALGVLLARPILEVVDELPLPERNAAMATLVPAPSLATTHDSSGR